MLAMPCVSRVLFLIFHIQNDFGKMTAAQAEDAKSFLPAEVREKIFPFDKLRNGKTR